MYWSCCLISFLICHTWQLDGLSWQRRNPHYLGCKQICAQHLKEISFLCVWTISRIFYISSWNMGPTFYMLRLYCCSVYITVCSDLASPSASPLLPACTWIILLLGHQTKICSTTYALRRIIRSAKPFPSASERQQYGHIDTAASCFRLSIMDTLSSHYHNYPLIPVYISPYLLGGVCVW